MATRSNWILTGIIGVLIPTYSVFFPIYPLIITGIIGGLLLYFGLTHRWIYFFLLPVFLVVNTALVKIGQIHFTFLPQLRDMIHSKPFELLFSGHIWGPRFLVSYPSIIISDWSNWNIDSSFTIYTVILILLLVLINAKIGFFFNYIRASSPFLFGFNALICTSLLSLLMNGRLVAAFLGISLILYVQIKKIHDRSNFKIKDVFLFFLGFFLSTVSSGTMMVTLGQIIIVSMLIIKMNGFSVKRIMLLLIGLSFVLGPYILKMVNKNLNYYGGGVKGLYYMLAHGLGKIVMSNSTAVIVIGVLFIPLFYIFIRTIKSFNVNNPKLIPLICSLPISMACGLFGFSTALMILPSLILLFSYFLLCVWDSMPNKKSKIDSYAVNE